MYTACFVEVNGCPVNHTTSTFLSLASPMLSPLSAPVFSCAHAAPCHLAPLHSPIVISYAHPCSILLYCSIFIIVSYISCTIPLYLHHLHRHLVWRSVSLSQAFNAGPSLDSLTTMECCKCFDVSTPSTPDLTITRQESDNFVEMCVYLLSLLGSGIWQYLLG